MSTEERVTALETNAVHNTATLEEVRRDVKEIKQAMTKQKGFIAGVLFVVAPLWVVVVTFFKTQWDRIFS